MTSAATSPTSQLVGHLIGHMLALTRHRDLHLLDMAIVAALQDLTRAQQVRLIDIVQRRGEILLQPRIWIQHDQTVPNERDTSPHLPDEAMTAYPFLQDALDQHLTQIEPADQPGDLWAILWRKDVMIGCLHICSDLPLSGPLRELAEGVLGVYRNQRDLLDYSERDSLTGLLNRKTFDEKFSRLVSVDHHRTAGGATETEQERRLQAAVPPRWLAAIDIDFFKRVNDRFGHLYGDEVLILVANLLRSSFRSEDLIFRFGGEEFVVLLRSTSLDQARMAFERFRANVEAHHFPQVGTVTITLGFTSITEATPVALLGNADQALYFGKTHGRNQICFFDELLREGLLDTVPAAHNEVLFFDEMPQVESDTESETGTRSPPAA